MSELTALTEILPLPAWMAATVLVLLLAVVVMAMRRSGSPGSMAALFGVPALVVIAWSAWSVADRQRVAEREALNARDVQLTALATVPGSALACLEGGAGETVNASCEAAIFRTAESVAAATVFVEARLRLLADGFDYAHRADTAYYNALNQLRKGLEADRYGFVAHVLMSRDGCTADSCVAFGWLLHDTGSVKGNMAGRKLEATIERYAVSWSGGSTGSAAGVATLPAAPFATTSVPIPVTRPIDFPSAASIPPVNIMTDQPNAAGSAATAAPPPPARRPPGTTAPARAPANPPSAANPAARPQ